MLNIFKNKNQSHIVSPVDGIACALSEGKDQVFAEGLMGPGCFIKPTNSVLYAPCDGTISTVFPTKHAYGLKTNSGVEMIIHIGIDTVNLQGELFQSYVKKGQRIFEGDLLVNFDLREMMKRKITPDIFIVFPNRPNLEVNLGVLEVGDLLFTLHP